MTEQELRALVREAIARHAAAPGDASQDLKSRDAIGPGAPQDGPHVFLQSPPPRFRHVSHATFMVPAGADSDGACLIEPAVSCNHCGYCKSYGH